MRHPHSVHPLLLEPTYWRNRLQELDAAQPTVLITPRPDLSGGGRDVVEFRVTAHDGVHLRGLLSRPTWRPGPWPAHIRSVGPAERPEADPACAQEGVADFVFQEPAGRRLEDRVLDVVHVHRVAFQTEGIDPRQVTFACPTEDHRPDEFTIAEHLFAGKFC
jgi:hypothetical protein